MKPTGTKLFHVASVITFNYVVTLDSMSFNDLLKPYNYLPNQEKKRNKWKQKENKKDITLTKRFALIESILLI